jgi:hypothetical protein
LTLNVRIHNNISHGQRGITFFHEDHNGIVLNKMLGNVTQNFEKKLTSTHPSFCSVLSAAGTTITPFESTVMEVIILYYLEVI